MFFKNFHIVTWRDLETGILSLNFSQKLDFKSLNFTIIEFLFILHIIKYLGPGACPLVPLPTNQLTDCAGITTSENP